MAQTQGGRHKRGSTLTEMFKLAGDMMGDGINAMMMGKMEDELSLDDDSPIHNNNHRGRWDSESSEDTGGEGYRELRKEFRKSEEQYYDDDSFTTTASEEQRQERVRQIRQREMENYRRHRDVGDDRELDLKQKLSQFEEEIIRSNSENPDLVADPDFVYHGPTNSMTSSSTNMAVSPEEEEETNKKEHSKIKNLLERAQERAHDAIRAAVSKESLNALSGNGEVSREEESVFTEEEEEEANYAEENGDYEEEEEDEDDFADQIVHEMMQLLHHSRKNRHEAERLIDYKRAFIRQRHETNPELDRHIAKNANYKKLECSARRFVRHLQDGDVPRTEQTLGMEKELLQNVAAMRAVRRESDELDMEFDMMFDAAE